MLQITPRSGVEFPEMPSWQPANVAVDFWKQRVAKRMSFGSPLSATAAVSAIGFPTASVSEECASLELDSGVHPLFILQQNKLTRNIKKLETHWPRCVQ